MTAPAREAGSSGRAANQRTTQPDREPASRGRSVAAAKAYAKRAQRSARGSGERAPRPERRTGSASRVTFVLLVMALLVAGVVVTLWFATQAAADAYKLEQAHNATNALSVRVEQLQRQVAQQDSPPSLEARARQLGMVPAGDAAHLVVGPNGQVTVIGTPSAVTAPPTPTTTTTTPPPPPATSGTTPPATTPTSAGG